MNKLFLNFYFLIIFLNKIYCDEVLVQINVNRAVNIISNKYVSFSIDPKIISESVGGNNSQIIDHMASQLSPAYFKIAGQSFFKLTSVLSNNIEIENDVKDNKPEDLLKNFNDWISSVGWKPIVPLPYSPSHWDSMEALRILNISSALGIKDCIWQLGIDFNATEATNYVADLITLQTMVGAFQEYVNDWRIVGADITAGSNSEETRLYMDLVKHIVEAVGWTPSHGYSTSENLYSVSDRDIALRNILSNRLPSWLSLPIKTDKYTNTDGCSVFCVTEGLQWAQILGDAARIGFKVVFKPLNINDFNEPSLNYYISLLFKRNMGEKVFDAKIIGGDKFISRVYSHCSKEKSGGISVMAINMADTRSKILAKFSSKSTGSELWQYIITVNNGMIMLNDEKIQFNSTIDPFIKIKHPSRPISISLPPMSIGFWVLPHANHDECLFNGDKSNIENSSDELKRKNPKLRTSSDKLLQQLITKSAAAKASFKKRERRHAVVKKDSKHLNQQLSDHIMHPNANLMEDTTSRYKRFILKSEKPKNLLLNIFETHDLLNGNHINSQFKKLDVLKSTGKRTKRQAVIDGGGLPGLFGRRRPGLRGKFPLAKNMQQRLTAAAAAANSGVGAGAGASSIAGSGAITGSGAFNKQQSTTPEVPEDKIFQRQDNVNTYHVPNGDVHFKLTNGDGDYDYVEFDGNKDDFDQKKGKMHDVPDDESLGKIPSAFHESYHIEKVIPRENAYSNGEIWEAISKPDLQRIDQEVKKFPDDKHIAYITRELEPTFNQNYAGLRQAQQNLQTYYMHQQQSVDSKEHYNSPMEYNSPATFGTVGSGLRSQQQKQQQQHQQNQQTHYGYPDHDDDDNFFNSQESFSSYNNQSPLQTLTKPSAKNNHRYQNLRWKRSTICNEKYIFNNKKSKKLYKCKNFKENSNNLKNNNNEHSRKRRNAVLKSISWALSNEVNVIPKEMNRDDEVYKRILPYRIIPRNYHISMRPHNYADIEKWRNNNNLNDNLYNIENLENINERTSNTEKRHIDNSKIDDNKENIIEYNSEEKPPKFMQLFSEKVSNFMDMINHHVSGWWNTWA